MSMRARNLFGFADIGLNKQIDISTTLVIIQTRTKEPYNNRRTKTDYCGLLNSGSL